MNLAGEMCKTNHFQNRLHFLVLGYRETFSTLKHNMLSVSMLKISQRSWIS